MTSKFVFGVFLVCSTFKQLLCHGVQPSIQPFIFPDNIKISQDFSIACAVMTGAIPITFKWFKDGKLLKGKDQSQEKISSLVIDSISKSSGGNYTCVASNAFGKDAYSSVLKVRAPPSWIKVPEDIETVEGNIINVQCLANGSPSPRILWKKEAIITADRNFLELESSNSNGSLSLSPVTKDDEGRYMCVAENGEGESLAKTIAVTVHGRKNETQGFKWSENPVGMFYNTA